MLIREVGCQRPKTKDQEDDIIIILFSSPVFCKSTRSQVCKAVCVKFTRLQKKISSSAKLIFNLSHRWLCFLFSVFGIQHSVFGFLGCDDCDSAVSFDS